MFLYNRAGRTLRISTSAIIWAVVMRDWTRGSGGFGSACQKILWVWAGQVSEKAAFQPGLTYRNTERSQLFIVGSLNCMQ